MKSINDVENKLIIHIVISICALWFSYSIYDIGYINGQNAETKLTKFYKCLTDGTTSIQICNDLYGK